MERSTRRNWRHLRILAGVLAASVTLGGRVDAQQSADWTEPFPPFRIAGNLYYVGSKGLASYLITTSQGHILINSELEANVPLIRSSVEQLGLQVRGHQDPPDQSRALGPQRRQRGHQGADGREVHGHGRRRPGRRIGRQDRFSVRQRCRRRTIRRRRSNACLRDGDEVRLGGAVLVARLTPGHTKGCTTWTMKVEEAGRTYDVVIIGSPNVNPGYRLVGNAAYPQIADDYERTFRVLKALPCDIFLGAHGSYFDLAAKYGR